MKHKIPEGTKYIGYFDEDMNLIQLVDVEGRVCQFEEKLGKPFLAQKICCEMTPEGYKCGGGHC